MTETYTLQYPIDRSGEEVTELTVRRPKLRDLEAAEKIKDDLQKSKKMIGDLASLTPAEVADLDVADFKALTELVGEFMGDGEG